MDANFFLQNKKFVKFYNIYKYIINIISNYSVYIYISINIINIYAFIQTLNRKIYRMHMT